jgi:hypothetical protein
MPPASRRIPVLVLVLLDPPPPRPVVGTVVLWATAPPVPKKVFPADAEQEALAPSKTNSILALRITSSRVERNTCDVFGARVASWIEWHGTSMTRSSTTAIQRARGKPDYQSSGLPE